jgi:hypothetical protein
LIGAHLAPGTWATCAGEGLGKSSSRDRDFCLVEQPIPESRTLNPRAVEREFASDMEEHTVFHCATLPQLEVDRWIHVDPHLQASWWPPIANHVSKVALKRGAERIAARVVDAPHAAHVTLNLSVVEELGNGTLQHRITLPIDECALGFHPLDELVGCYNERKP